MPRQTGVLPLSSLFIAPFDAPSVGKNIVMTSETPATTILLATTLATSLVAGGTLYFVKQRLSRPYVHVVDDKNTSPPGPPRALLGGNVKNFPKDRWTETFTAWTKTYGDVIYIQLPKRPILILNSLSDADDMLNKRAGIYSGRPDNFMVNVLMDFSWSISQAQPGPKHNEARKVFRKSIGPRAVADFDTLLEADAEKLVAAFTGFSGDPREIIVDTVSGSVLKLAYGEKVAKKHGSQLVQLNEQAITIITSSSTSVWLPNIIPIARYLPKWLPGLSFHEFADKSKYILSQLRSVAYDEVKLAADQGKGDLSIVSRYLNETEFTKEDLRDAVAMLYIGGVDTTSIALLNFVGQMVIHPDILRKIQTELDDKIGRGRVPRASEMDSLTYLRAVWKESIRFHAPVSVSIPHCSLQDDVWKGYFIPKGTVIIPNIEFMLRDPRFWGKDADVFNPDRFLVQRELGQPDVDSIPFGFGRRICPGRFLSARNGMLYAAALLATYDVLPLEGDKAPTGLTHSEGKFKFPTNVKCRFVARQ